MIASLKRWWMCRVLADHDWSATLDEVPASSVFHRIDCRRCDHSIDGAQLRRIRDANPDLWVYVKGRMP